MQFLKAAWQGPGRIGSNPQKQRHYRSQLAAWSLGDIDAQLQLQSQLPFSQLYSWRQSAPFSRGYFPKNV